jgi:hypothetical protein
VAGLEGYYDVSMFPFPRRPPFAVAPAVPLASEVFAMISFDCPGCAKPIKVKDDLAGKKGKCPGCGQAVTVPALPVNGGDRPAAEEAKKGEEKKGSGTLTKVIATVFGAVLAPVLVGVAVKWSDPSLWRTAPATQAAPATTPGSEPASHERPSTFSSLPRGHQVLFNGKDLAGWITADGKPGNWQVAGELLTCVGPPSYLYTLADDWADIHLRAEARINSGGNSGVFFRVNRPLKFGEGFEAQIEYGTDRQMTGSLYNLVPLAESPVAPDAWFTLDVIARGRHIQVQVDGKKVVDYTDVKNNRLRGHIALQHSSPQTRVFFRHIEARRLP